mgnify:CR=1 FL=1
MKNKGFTLLELLIVVAIVGVLAGVTVISFPLYAKKARLSNAIKFSDNLRGSLQQDMIAWWSFDETSGSVAKDSWWNQLNGTTTGATRVVGLKGNALSFDGNDYVSVPNSSFLNNYSGLTLEAWIKPSSNNVVGAIIHKYYTNCTLRQFLLRRESNNRIGFWMGYNNGASSYVIYTPANSLVLAENGWAHIVATWNKQKNTMKIYLNAKEVVSYTNATLSWTTNTACSLEIGRYSSNYFVGIIDEARIYSSALVFSEIEKHYANGLKKHSNLLVER